MQPPIVIAPGRMKVSVIMPAFNRDGFIATAIRSLLRQRDDAVLDIIVVDDGSTDRTADVVSAIAETEPCVRLIRQANGGVTRARNNGLSHVPADADFVTFLDSDDVSIAGRFATELPLFAQDPDLAMTYSMTMVTNEIDDRAMVPTATSETVVVRGISVMNSLFRKHAIDALGGFNEKLDHFEDWDFLLRFFESRVPYRAVDNVAILYRRHPGNMTRDIARARRNFLLVMMLSAQRRRADPTIGQIPRFFDLSKLQDERYAVLR